MINLTQDNLANYFRIADKDTSWYKEPTNTYIFKNRDSNTLLVTIGDSWTHGAGLGEKKKKDYLYGNIISEKLKSDWLNLGLSAVGNFWITERAEELSKILSNLKYEKVIVLIMFTGVGRGFDTLHDNYIVYDKWFNENIKTSKDFDKILHMLNVECVNRIVKAFEDTEVTLKFSTNFVEHLGFENLEKKYIIDKPWYSLFKQSDIDIYHDASYFRLGNAIQWVRSDLKDDFKKWILQLIELSNQRNDFLNQIEGFIHCHPDKNGHKLWADYVLQELND